LQSRWKTQLKYEKDVFRKLPKRQQKEKLSRRAGFQGLEKLLPFFPMLGKNPAKNFQPLELL